jgi:hypothetical protein
LNATVADSSVFQGSEAPCHGRAAAQSRPGVVGTIGPVLPSGFMPVQWGAITYLASGLSAGETAKRCGVSRNTVSKWLQDGRFMRAVQEATLSYVGRIQAFLLEGEVRASQTLIAALDAMMPAKSGSKVMMVPDWPARIRAADSLLDRRSERGKAVDRVQAQHLNLNQTDVRSELARALHDPEVQQMLRENPELQKQLVSELAQSQGPPSSAIAGETGPVRQYSKAGDPSQGLCTDHRDVT